MRKWVSYSHHGFKPLTQKQGHCPVILLSGSDFILPSTSRKMNSECTYIQRTGYHEDLIMAKPSPQTNQGQARSILQPSTLHPQILLTCRGKSGQSSLDCIGIPLWDCTSSGGLLMSMWTLLRSKSKRGRQKSF